MKTRRSDGRGPTPRAVILWLLALVLGGTGGISLHPYITPEGVIGAEVKTESPRKRVPPKPKVSDDCYWVIDGRDYKRNVDVYPCIYRATAEESS